MRLSASAAVSVAAAFAAAAALLTLAACGQKGPLYLPDKNASVVGGGVPPPAQSGPAVPAPAPQPQSTPEQTLPGTPAEPLSTPPPQDAQPAPPPPRDKTRKDDDSQKP
jgi:predicted small lipoprotein YifL